LTNPDFATKKLLMSLTNLLFGCIGVLLGLRYNHPLIGYFCGAVCGLLAYLVITRVMSRHY
jgi:hypothetical protein